MVDKFNILCRVIYIKKNINQFIMCIILEEIKNISNTEIFISIDKIGSRELVIYKTCIENDDENNFMIIPVPNPDTVKFYNL